MVAMSAAVAAQGGAFLEAPVSGSKGPAAAGQLIFLCAGDEATYAAAAPELGERQPIFSYAFF
jgi:3-hydroxyisobutyrate dehydrogenase-like beta-hydroxyacid dehydrogenase